MRVSVYILIDVTVPMLPAGNLRMLAEAAKKQAWQQGSENKNASVFFFQFFRS